MRYNEHHGEMVAVSGVEITLATPLPNPELCSILKPLPRPPNYPLIIHQLPTIKYHKGSIQGPLGGPGSRGLGLR